MRKIFYFLMFGLFVMRHKCFGTAATDGKGNC